jgi:hypothetical protein
MNTLNNQQMTARIFMFEKIRNERIYREKAIKGEI